VEQRAQPLVAEEVARRVHGLRDAVRIDEQAVTLGQIGPLLGERGVGHDAERHGARRQLLNLAPADDQGRHVPAFRMRMAPSRAVTSR